jgi:D-sedoheptulose 7-phosphate isomerase
MANALERLATEARDVGAFADGYFNRLKSILDRIDRNAVARLAQELESARAEGATVFLVGNGGSATLASSMANDLGLDVVRKAGTPHPFRMSALTDSVAAITAIANDVGYENAFVNQLRMHYREGDRLIVVSASGNSPNVVNAAQYVKERGGRVLGLLGFSGGVLLGMCDVTVHVPSEAGEYGPVEDVHLIVSHILAHWFQVRFRGQ